MKRCLSCGGEVRNVYKSLWLCLKEGHAWNSHGTFETGVFGWVPDLLAEIDRLKGDLEEHRTAAEYYSGALGMCEAKLTHAHDELAKVKEAIACLEAANAEFVR